MHPIVVRSEPIYLAGLSAELPPRSAPPDARPRVIQELSRTVMAKVAEIGNRKGAERYSVIENDVHEGEGGATPLIRVMVAVESLVGLPAWCEPFTIEPGRYAVFEHRGLPRDLSKTVAGIYKDWVPRIEGLFASPVEIVVYPAGYVPTDPDGRFAYWLPLP